MATSSITKRFIIEGEETFEKLLDILEQPVSPKHITTNFYEAGKKKLVQYFGPCDKWKENSLGYNQ